MTNFDAIVIGAGIAGKTTSLRLAKLGLKILHIAPNFDPGSHSNGEDDWDSRIYALSSSTQQLLSDLHVWEAMNMSRIEVVSEMRIYGDSGHLDDELHFSAYGATVPQLAWIVESSHIEKTLDAASQFAGNIKRIVSTVIDFSSTKEHVIVQASSGESYRAKLLIAADGANSPTRQKLNIETSVNQYEQTAVVANFKCEKPHLGTACQWFLPEGEILALLPLPNQRLSMVWSAKPAHAEKLKTMGEEALCAEVMSASGGDVGRRTGALKMMTPPQAFPLRRMRAQRIIAPEVGPRIILVGDAAHVMHPLAGQGLNLGLRDDAALGKTLEEREPFRAIDDSVLLRRYERSRHGDTDALLLTTDQLQKLFVHDSRALKKIRNLGLRIVNRSHFLKRQLIKKALA